MYSSYASIEIDLDEISNNQILKSTFCNYSARRSKPDVSPCTIETVCSASIRSHKLQLLRNPRVTSDRALMHSEISVIARCSHERRVNPLPDDNGHPFTEARRRFWRGPREASVLCLLAELSSSSLSTQTD